MPQMTRRRLLNASAINGGGFILASAMALLWSFLVVRMFAGDASGQLLLALSVAGLINLLDLGASMGLIRVISAADASAYPHSPWNYFRAAIWVTSLTELVVGTIAVATWHMVSVPGLSTVACICIVAFAVSAQGVLLSASALKGLLDFKKANLVATGSTLAVYGVGVMTIFSGQDVWFVLLSMTGIQTLTALVAVVVATKCLQTKSHAPNDSPHKTPVRQVYFILLRSSLPMFPQMFTGIFFMHAQRFIIARYAGLDAVAIVSLAYSIATRIHAVVNAFLEVIFPMARQLREQGIKPGAFCLRVGSLTAAVYFVCACIAATVTGALLPDILPALSVFSVGVMFAIAAAPAFHLLNGSGASAQVSLCSLLSPFLFVLLASLLHTTSMLSGSLLLPVAYAITMAVMLLHVAWLVMQKSNCLASV